MTLLCCCADRTPSGRWSRSDLHPDFAVLSNDVVAVESGEVASKKKAKNERNRLVIVSLKGASVPAVRQGWLRCQMQQTGEWERRYVVLTADERTGSGIRAQSPLAHIL